MRGRLIDTVAHELEGKFLTPALTTRLIELCCEVMPASVHGPTLADSLRNLAGTTLTREVWAETAHRLAGNVPRLAARRSVGPWLVQRGFEWVPVQITASYPSRGSRGKLGALMTMKILAGTPCPRVMQKWWSFARCRYLARFLGFTRLRGRAGTSRYPFTAVEHLVGMYLYVLIDPDLSGEEPDFYFTRFPTAVVSRNRELIKRRARIDKGYTCPLDHPSSFHCQRCWMGYLECPAGTHRKNYEEGPCSACRRERAYFDPERPGACVECQNQAAMSRKEV